MKVRILMLGAGMALAVYFLFLIRKVLPAFALGLVAAYILRLPVDWLEKTRFPRSVAIGVVYLALTAALAVVVYFAWPALVGELGRLFISAPLYSYQWQRVAEGLQDRYSGFLGLGYLAEEVTRTWKTALSGATRRIAQSAMNFMALSPTFLLVPVISFYVLRDREKLASWLTSLIPERYLGIAERIWRETDRVVGGYLRGYLVMAFIIGTLTAVGLAVIKVRFPVLLGLVAALGELIPFVGPFAAGAIAVGMALAESIEKGIYALIYVLAVQQVEANFLAPRLLGGGTGLHPLAVIISLVAGAELMGIWGFLLAVPLAGIVRSLGRWLWERLFTNG